ncbi:MAG TPA: hypothetical protein VMQ67_09175, partial [Candidatus Saccharimonadales bacterium]|nr:hypothetical protein [Candidatus Saccharimonadales bacterium]
VMLVPFQITVSEVSEVSVMLSVSWQSAEKAGAKIETTVAATTPIRSPMEFEFVFLEAIIALK